MQRIIHTAHGRVERVNLTVTAVNEAALHLYQRHGFRIYGTEPDALKVAGRNYDEHLMTREIGAQR